MSTRGSIAIDRQRYLRETEPGEGPDAVADPRVADDVRLHSEEEDGAEHCGDRGRAASDEADEHGEVPCDPEQRADEARLGADLRVVRLPRLDRGAGAGGRLAGVAEAVPLWVVHDGAHALAQADPVIVNRGLVDAACVASGAGMLLRDVVLEDEVLLRPLPFG